MWRSIILYLHPGRPKYAFRSRQLLAYKYYQFILFAHTCKTEQELHSGLLNTDFEIHHSLSAKTQCSIEYHILQKCEGGYLPKEDSNVKTDEDQIKPVCYTKIFPSFEERRNTPAPH
ncbi:hypothetical protein VULLAG_LOCUS4614 [Vulpes lagopus]